MPVAEISRITRYSQSAIRHTLRSLELRKLIEVRNYIDVFQLGLSSYVMLYSLRSTNLTERREILNSIAALPGVVWFAEVGGEYQYITNFCQGDVHQLVHLLDQLGDKFGHLFLNKILAQHFSYRDYSYGFLCTDSISQDFVGTEQQRKVTDIDLVDHSILRLIASSSLSQRQIAKEIGLPSSTVQYRLEKLKKMGIWKRSIYILNHSALGFNFVLYRIYANSSSSKLREKLHAFALGNKNIITLAQSVGPWDFEISAVARYPSTLHALRQELMAEFSHDFTSIVSIPVYQLLKWNQYPFETFNDYLQSIGAVAAASGLKRQGNAPSGVAGHLEWSTDLMVSNS